MKQIAITNQLTLVGKAWEIRRQLQQLLMENSKLSDYLNQQRSQ